MGGRPLLGLNIVAFPVGLPKDVLGEMLKGGAAKAAEAGVLVVGGHTIDDKEPKYGMAVTGLVKPGAQVTNAGARPGDSLVLTKPIGTGIITTAGKNRHATPEVLEGAIESMRTLNHAASDVMVDVGVNACVDVTGFGLIGHLLGMLEASNVSARISLVRVPVLDGARDLVEHGVAPGGTRRNLDSANHKVGWVAAGDEPTRLLLCDAQTSGGLLIAAAPEKRDRLVGELLDRGMETAAVIGETLDRDALGGKRIEVAA